MGKKNFNSRLTHPGVMIGSCFPSFPLFYTCFPCGEGDMKTCAVVVCLPRPGRPAGRCVITDDIITVVISNPLDPRIFRSFGWMDGRKGLKMPVSPWGNRNKK